MIADKLVHTVDLLPQASISKREMNHTLPIFIERRLQTEQHRHPPNDSRERAMSPKRALWDSLLDDKFFQVGINGESAPPADAKPPSPN